VRAELLSLLLVADERWVQEAVPGTDDERLAQLVVEKNKEQLLHCYAAALFWIDHYARVLPTLPPATHCLIFSGSLIYQRVLLDVLRMSRTKSLVVEHFMTGTDYYLESRTTPIANASDFRLPTIHAAASLPEDPEGLSRERIKAARKILDMVNKNVKQPAKAPTLSLAQGKPTLLVLGQVQNDFSILETRLENINALDFWRNGIRVLLEATDANIIFKAHPWERHKANVKSPFTREKLEAWRETLPPEQAARFVVVEDANIEQLASQASHVLALCSQGALELAFRTGHKPVVFGRPFYGRAGFTSDYSRVEDFAKDLAAGKAPGALSLDEYEAFDIWITRFLQAHLACVHTSGQARVRAALSSPNVLRIDAQPVAAAKPKPTLQPGTPVTAKPPLASAKPEVAVTAKPPPASAKPEVAVTAKPTSAGASKAALPVQQPAKEAPRRGIAARLGALFAGA
jgi:hypothetical protein